MKISNNLKSILSFFEDIYRIYEIIDFLRKNFFFLIFLERIRNLWGELWGKILDFFFLKEICAGICNDKNSFFFFKDSFSMKWSCIKISMNTKKPKNFFPYLSMLENSRERKPQLA